jgi:hypothetical protein
MVKMDVAPTLRFYSPNLKFLLFATGQAVWCRKDFGIITGNDQKEALDALDLLMEDDAGHC